jgi:hypothetical protein
VHDRRQRVLVDAEVVPVDEEHEVREAEAPRGVLRLVRRARRETALALDDEHLHLAGARELQRDGLPDRRRHAVPGRAGVRLQEERLARELRVSREAAVAPEHEEVLPRERVPPVVRERERGIAVAVVPRAHRLVQHRERRVHERDGVPGGEDEAVGERAPRTQEVPAHRAGEHEREQEVDLRA